MLYIVHLDNNLNCPKQIALNARSIEKHTTEQPPVHSSLMRAACKNIRIWPEWTAWKARTSTSFDWASLCRAPCYSPIKVAHIFCSNLIRNSPQHQLQSSIHPNGCSWHNVTRMLNHFTAFIKRFRQPNNWKELDHLHDHTPFAFAISWASML